MTESQRAEETMRIVVGQHLLRLEPQGPGARQRIGTLSTAPAISSCPSTPSVSPASACMRACPSSATQGTAEIRHCARRVRCRAPSPWSRRPTAGCRAPRTVDRDRRRACAMPRIPCPRRALRPRWRRSRIWVAIARGARHGRGRLERHLRRGDDDALGARQPRIARLHGFPASALQQFEHGLREPRSRSGAGCASASAQVVGSATVGPEAISTGRSPGTSEISSVSTCAGWQAAASRPPLMADKCRRTQFISLMVAPDASRARPTLCLTSSVSPVRRQGQQRRTAARDQAQHQVIAQKACRPARACARARACRRHRAQDAQPRRSRSLARNRVSVARDHQPATGPRPMSSTACAIAAEALPAPSTIRRPRGACGRWRGMQPQAAPTRWRHRTCRSQQRLSGMSGAGALPTERVTLQHRLEQGRPYRPDCA